MTRTHLITKPMNFETQLAPSAPPVVNTPVTNNFLYFIDAQENMTTGAAAVLYTKLINALSAKIVDHLRWHVILRNSGRLEEQSRQYFNELNGKTLDERNEADENERGQELKDYLTDISGHTVRMPHMKAAGILNGIRFSLYDKLASYVDVPNPDLIMNTIPEGVSMKELRTFPLGIETCLQGLIERTGVPSNNMLAEAEAKAKAFGRSTEAAKAAAKEEALRQQRQLMSLYQDIMAEAATLPDEDNEDDWTALDLQEREQIISRVKANLNRTAEAAWVRLAVAKAGSDWERTQRDAMADAEHAESVVDAFIAAHPFTTLDSPATTRQAVTAKLGGAYKPKDDGGIADMADDLPS